MFDGIVKSLFDDEHQIMTDGRRDVNGLEALRQLQPAAQAGRGYKFFDLLCKEASKAFQSVVPGVNGPNGLAHLVNQ